MTFDLETLKFLVKEEVSFIVEPPTNYFIVHLMKDYEGLKYKVKIAVDIIPTHQSRIQFLELIRNAVRVLNEKIDARIIFPKE